MCITHQFYRGFYIEPAGWLSECIVGRQGIGEFWMMASRKGFVPAIWENRRKFRIFRGVKNAKRFIDRLLEAQVTLVELLDKLAQDYNHPWPQEDSGTKAHRRSLYRQIKTLKRSIANGF